MEKNNDCCFKDILKVIDVLQRNVEKCEEMDETCARPFLGNFVFGDVFNTRPVTFYAKDGSLYEIPFTMDGMEGVSSVFRVEKVNDCCVTVEVLAESKCPTRERPFVRTGQFATINLECVCVLKCLDDVIVDNV